MHAPTLTVDLSALRANYRLLKSRHAKKSIAAVVKANAYGLGVNDVSKALWQEGCREFFVATLQEGIELGTSLREGAADEAIQKSVDRHASLAMTKIAVFNGPFVGEEKDYAQHRLTPVLNTLEQSSAASGQRSVILHVDTGMTRLGLSESDLKKISDWPLTTGRCQLVMSHLACASEPAHPKNAEQLARFKQALALFPGARASLCNSSGLFLSDDFHFDVARPGCALYGINPTAGSNPMQPVVTLSAPLLQIRTLDRDETISYGATVSAKKGSRIAVVSLGYADGVLRALSNKGFAFVEGIKVPIVGRVSMDMVTLDVSSIPEGKITAESRAEFINRQQTVDDIAAAANTIGYEILTRIGDRVRREYR